MMMKNILIRLFNNQMIGIRIVYYNLMLKDFVLMYQ